MKYKIGDEVKIKDNLVSGVDGIVPSMLKYAGKTYTIENIVRDTYLLDGTSFYRWTDENIENDKQTELEQIKKQIETLKHAIETFINSRKKQSFDSVKINDEFWENFKNRQFAINCTFKNAHIFLRMCDEQNIKFIFGEDETLIKWFDDRIIHQYEKEVCFMCGQKPYFGLVHSSKDFYLEEGFKVLEFSDLHFEKTLKDYTSEELIKELIRRNSN